MNIFGLAEAGYYCSSFSSAGGDAEGSINDFQRNYLHSGTIIAEGTQVFQQYRDCSLRDIERSLFFAASHYRRSLDLMTLSASPWAHVTLYYGSWYASHALMGMFGCTIFGNKKLIIDVNRGTPGTQELRVRRIGTSIGQEYCNLKGSHRIFWGLFYVFAQQLRPYLSARFAAALSPITGNSLWQIDTRNNVNYDSFIGINLAEDFGRTFSKNGFPGCLPGVLNTQFKILETILELIYSYAKQFNLRTDSLDLIGGPAGLDRKVRQLIYNDKPPGLVLKTTKFFTT